MVKCTLCGRTPGEAGKIYRSKVNENIRLCPECKGEEPFAASIMQRACRNEVILNAINRRKENVRLCGV